MMLLRKLNGLTRIAGFAVVVLCLLAVAGSSSAWGSQRSDTGVVPPSPYDTLAETLPPTTVTVDDEGYTIWTVDWSYISWCVPVSTLRYPLDLGTHDPTELGDTSLILTYNKGLHTIPDNVVDPSWTVALNGKPPGDWRAVGSIDGPPTHERVWNTEVIPIDPLLVIDGENNVWLQQHDNCPQSPGCETCACTCVDLSRVALRATVDLRVKQAFPKHEAKNIAPDQRTDSEIRVKFSTLPDPKSVNKQTFQVYYLDDAVNPVIVDGSVAPKSDTEFIFTPQEKLRDGIRYFARVWGQEEAEADGRDQWVTDLGGNPMQEGKTWWFWTLPELQVDLVPVQVLEGYALVANKPTVLKTYVRWDRKEDVFWRDQVTDVELYDVSLTWTALSGDDKGSAKWRGDGEDDSDFYQWRPWYSPEYARRKREYREFTEWDESYHKYEKLMARDSINYFGFTPWESGSYSIRVAVNLLDSRGEQLSFPALITPQVFAIGGFGVRARAMGVGDDFGKLGTADLSTHINDSIYALKSIFPMSRISSPWAPGSIPYYEPSTPADGFSWSDKKGTNAAKLALLQELSAMCARTTGCNAMVGFAPQAWITDLGVTLPESAARGALVQKEYHDAYRFVLSHEVGHLLRFEHLDLHGGEGFDVAKRRDRRNSVAQLPPKSENIRRDIFDFMVIDPAESPEPELLWIGDYRYLWILNAAIVNVPTAMRQTASTDRLLLASGSITEATGEVKLLPWYQLEPGSWTAPITGSYTLVFQNAAGQDIVGYSQPFTASSTLQPAGSAPRAASDRGWFVLKVPYPEETAKIQIRKTEGGSETVLQEIVPSATAPSLSIDAPASTTWSGPQTLSWQSDAGTRYFAVDVSVDNAASWEAFAIHLTDRSYSVETTSLPDTTQAWVRVSASDGLQTTDATAGPFVIDNPPAIASVSPLPGETMVDVDQPIVVGFRDAMDPATIHGGTFSVSGGPFGTVTGTIAYDDADREATFIPRVSLAFATTYTVTVTTGVKDASGEALPAAKSWAFTTGQDILPPHPIAFLPEEGMFDVALDTPVLVVWDQDLNASTINTGTFTLATASGSAVNSSVTYSATARSATLIPLANLSPNTTYVVSMTAGIEDVDGNATPGALHWAFTTGSEPISPLALSGAYVDYGVDDNGDGLFEQLVIKVGIQVTATGAYGLKGSLVDGSGGEIAWAEESLSLQPGAAFVDLVFEGTKIGGHGVDGPYTLTGLTLIKAQDVDSTRLDSAVWAMDAYQTFAYAASQFPAPLRFTGLPSLVLRPGSNLDPAFNVQSYAEHVVRSSEQLSYTLLANADLRAGVTLGDDGYVGVNPESGWLGSAEVVIQASDGTNAVQDTFWVTVGWVSELYLPLILRDSDSSSVQTARSNWRTAFFDDFEASAFSWSTWSSISVPPGGWYYWARRDCAAYSGQYSAWPFGGGETGEATPCGADYPNTLYSTMRFGPSVNLKYTSQAEFRVKVWTDLAPGDEICLMASTSDLPPDLLWQAQFYGVCRSGKTDGWEDFLLDLSDVPTLGSLLGQDPVWLAVRFIANESGTRPVGAYVDDAELRVCPQGLTCQP